MMMNPTPMTSLTTADYEAIQRERQGLRAAIAESLAILDDGTNDEDRVSGEAYNAYMLLKNALVNPPSVTRADQAVDQPRAGAS